MSANERYTVLFDIAQGGMGIVSAALLRGEHGFRRTVAVKRIIQNADFDQVFRTKLAREAVLASKIRDPGIVQVLELTQRDGELALVMELVEGVSVRELIAAHDAIGATVPRTMALRIVAKAARALHAAHIATDDDGTPLAIVHCDISPHNLMVSFTGDVKVTDFGIARALAAEESSASSASAIRGKPAYLAPEQVTGGAIDRRADVFSLAVVAWELLTGKRLFKGRNDLESLRLLLESEIPRVDDFVPDLPRALGDAIASALDRSPGKRPDTALEFAERLEAACRDLRATRDELARCVADSFPGRREAFAERIRDAIRTAEEGSRIRIEAKGPRASTWPRTLGSVSLGFMATWLLLAAVAPAARRAEASISAPPASAAPEPPPPAPSTPAAPLEVVRVEPTAAAVDAGPPSHDAEAPTRAKRPSKSTNERFIGSFPL